MWRLMGEATMFVAIFGSCFEPKSHSGQVRVAVRVELWVYRRARADQNSEGNREPMKD